MFLASYEIERVRPPGSWKKEFEIGWFHFPFEPRTYRIIPYRLLRDIFQELAVSVGCP